MTVNHIVIQCNIRYYFGEHQSFKATSVYTIYFFLVIGQYIWQSEMKHHFCLKTIKISKGRDLLGLFLL